VKQLCDRQSASGLSEQQWLQAQALDIQRILDKTLSFEDMTAYEREEDEYREDYHSSHQPATFSLQIDPGQISSQYNTLKIQFLFSLQWNREGDRARIYRETIR